MGKRRKQRMISVEEFKDQESKDFEAFNDCFETECIKALNDCMRYGKGFCVFELTECGEVTFKHVNYGDNNGEETKNHQAKDET